MSKSISCSLLSILLTIFSSKSIAQNMNKPLPLKPVLLIAKEVTYDKEFGVVKAHGDVEIEHEGRVLYADQVKYNKLTNKIFAEGHIRIHETSGEVLFLDKAELIGDLKTGVVDEIKMILTDQSRLIAARARRLNDQNSVFNQVVYSPCKTCRSQPLKSPLWQIKAREVVWDEQNEDIIYTDAFMEFQGMPVLYTPYLSHPAPNVKRRSGLLSPFFGGSVNYGFLIGAPYFWAIDPHSDMTISPMMVGDRPMLGLEYRQNIKKGRFMLGGSITDGDRTSGTAAQPQYQHNKIRGHVVGNGLLELDQHWRAGFLLERATDQTYLKKFAHLGMSAKNVLVTKGYLEGFSKRSYTGIKAYTFQGLHQIDATATTPIIFPKADINYTSQPNDIGGVWTFDGNVLGLSRQRGNDMQRLSGTLGWSVPYHGSAGYIVTSGVRGRSDYYHITDYQYASSANINPAYTGNITRGFVQAYSNFDYPFIKIDQNTRYIIEPRFGLVVAPNVGSSQKLPNEDTRVAELNDLNLFSENRLAGLDRIDGGTRFNYGFNFAAYDKLLGNADVFIGQSYAFSNPHEYLSGTGMDKKFSDYIGRLKISYNDWLTLRSRVLLDRHRLRSNQAEINGTIGKPIFNFNIDYIMIPRLTMDPLDQKGEQIRLTLSSKFTDYWSKTLSTTRALGSSGGTLSQEIGLQYQDECFIFNTLLQKTFYNDRDIKPGVTVMFRFVFKNLGGFEQSIKSIN